MAKFRTFAKIMAWLVLCGGIAITIVLAVTFFILASSYSYMRSAEAAFVWYGIGSLLIGSAFSIGNFALWNMFIEMYENSCMMKSKYCGDYYAQTPVYQPMQTSQQYAAPVQQSDLWYCPYCNNANSGSSSFCTYCGQQRK